MGMTFPFVAEIIKGDADGFVVFYGSTTLVTITSGFYEANGKKYILAANVTHTITGATIGKDRMYAYIDDSASTAPTPIFINSVTTPTYDPDRRGWYNGDDRLIGVFRTELGSTDIEYFDTTVISQKLIRYEAGVDDLAINMIPNDTWLTPNQNFVSNLAPVNAVEAKVQTSNTDSSSLAGTAWRSAESAAIITTPSASPQRIEAYSTGLFVSWGALGTSRNIRVSGRIGGNNDLDARLKGFGYSR